MSRFALLAILALFPVFVSASNLAQPTFVFTINTSLHDVKTGAKVRIPATPSEIMLSEAEKVLYFRFDEKTPGLIELQTVDSRGSSQDPAYIRFGKGSTAQAFKRMLGVMNANQTSYLVLDAAGAEAPPRGVNPNGHIYPPSSVYAWDVSKNKFVSVPDLLTEMAAREAATKKKSGRSSLGEYFRGLWR